MNRPGRSETGRGTESVAPSLFESNRVRGAIAASRRSGTRDLLLIPPLAAFLAVGCSLCIAMAEAPDSDGAAGENFIDGDYAFKILSDIAGSRTVEIWAYYGSGDAVTIPSTAEDGVTTYDVVSIGQSAFMNETNLTSVTIPGSVTTIGEGAFQDCSGLTSINLSSVGTIGYRAFYHCSGLASVDLSSIESIGSYAFGHCESLTSVDLSSVGTIGSYAFEACIGLTSVDLSSIGSIGSYAFSNCGRLTSIVIPCSVRTLEDYAFYGTGLTSIRFEEGIGPVNDSAFGIYGSGPENTKFYEEDSVTLITLASDAEKIGGRLFRGGLSTMTRQPLYTITFDLGDGTTEELTYNKGDNIVKPDDPVKTGYTFGYWKDESGEEFDFSTMTMPSRNMTLTAVWTPIEYAVTFYDGLQLVLTENCAYGDSMTLPGEDSGISKPGYALSGWQISGEGDVYEPGTTYTVKSDIAFTAVWEAVPSPQPPEQEDYDYYDEDPIYTPVVKPRASDNSLIVIVAACAATVMAALAMLVTGKPKG